MELTNSMNLTNIERRVEQGVRTMVSRNAGHLISRLAKNYMFVGANKIRTFETGIYSVRRSVRDFTWKLYASN